MQKIKFEQIPLFTGGYSLLTAEMQLHFDGRRNTIEVGYSIYATDTLQHLEGGTLGLVNIHARSSGFTEVLDELRKRALADLQPF